MYQAEELKNRSKQFAIRIVKLFRSLPRTEEARIIGKQVLRSGTSIAANYRAVCRARSKAEFIAKIGIVVEEADETVLWLELLVETDIANNPAWPVCLKSQMNYWLSLLLPNTPPGKDEIESMNQ